LLVQTQKHVKLRSLLVGHRQNDYFSRGGATAALVHASRFVVVPLRRRVKNLFFQPDRASNQSD
jgi:hypothetical protein